MNQISKTDDKSSLTDTSSAPESDRKLTSNSSVDLEYVGGGSDDELDVYIVSVI